MENKDKALGSLIAVHAIEPAYLQRAVFIVVLSFMFFLAMMFAFYIGQSFGYFLLASAFFVVYLVTMFSWLAARRSVVRIYENGLSYKNRTVFWNQIEKAETGVINIRGGKPISIPHSIGEAEKMFAYILGQIQKGKRLC